MSFQISQITKSNYRPAAPFFFFGGKDALKGKVANLFQQQMEACKKADEDRSRRSNEHSSLRQGSCTKVGTYGLAKIIMSLIDELRDETRKGQNDLTSREGSQLMEIFCGRDATIGYIRGPDSVDGLAKAFMQAIAGKGESLASLEQINAFVDKVWENHKQLPGYIGTWPVPDVQY